MFTTSNDSFGPTEISHLENRFCNLALEAKRYRVKNGNDPTPGNVTEEKESELDEFIDYAQIAMGALGHKVFVPLVKKEEEREIISAEDGDELLLHLQRKSNRSGRNLKAKCRRTAEGYVLLSGSDVERINTQYLLESLVVRKKNANIDENGVLQEDLLFSSPSAAASFVIGTAVNGREKWLTEDNKTLKEYEEEE